VEVPRASGMTNQLERMRLPRRSAARAVAPSRNGTFRSVAPIRNGASPTTAPSRNSGRTCRALGAVAGSRGYGHPLEAFCLSCGSSFRMSGTRWGARVRRSGARRCRCRGASGMTNLLERMWLPPVRRCGPSHRPAPARSAASPPSATAHHPRRRCRNSGRTFRALGAGRGIARVRASARGVLPELRFVGWEKAAGRLGAGGGPTPTRAPARPDAWP